MLIQADPGTEQYVIFARNKLKLWKDQMTAAGVGSFAKRIDVSDGATIYLNSAALGHGQYNDRIRITGGGRYQFGYLPDIYSQTANGIGLLYWSVFTGETPPAAYFTGEWYLGSYQTLGVLSVWDTVNQLAQRVATYGFAATGTQITQSVILTFSSLLVGTATVANIAVSGAGYSFDVVFSNYPSPSSVSGQYNSCLVFGRGTVATGVVSCSSAEIVAPLADAPSFATLITAAPEYIAAAPPAIADPVGDWATVYSMLRAGQVHTRWIPFITETAVFVATGTGHSSTCTVFGAPGGGAFSNSVSATQIEVYGTMTFFNRGYSQTWADADPVGHTSKTITLAQPVSLVNRNALFHVTGTPTGNPLLPASDLALKNAILSAL